MTARLGRPNSDTLCVRGHDVVAEVSVFFQPPALGEKTVGQAGKGGAIWDEVLVHAAQNAHGICRLCAGDEELFRIQAQQKDSTPSSGRSLTRLHQSGLAFAKGSDHQLAMFKLRPFHGMLRQRSSTIS